MRTGWWLLLGGNFVLAFASQSDSSALPQASIQRVVVYKDGHCFTQREANVVPNSETVYIHDLPNALLGTVWAYTRDKQVQVVRVQGQMIEEKRSIAPQNVAELLALNEGAKVEIELLFPSDAQSSGRASTTEIHWGTLRVFKPELRYTDVYPTHEAPPPYSPTPVVAPQPRRDDPYWVWRSSASSATPPAPPDYVQDEWSRRVSQCSFAIETEYGLVMFQASQVKRLRFLTEPKRTREVVVRQPRLELLLNGVKKGQPVPLVLCALEKGIRWIPEYHLILPPESGEQATLRLNATLINELTDLKDAEVHVTVGAPQFIMTDTVSPLVMRETFMRLSKWFGEPEDFYGRAISGAAGFGGFGGLPSVPSGGFGSGGMGFTSSGEGDSLESHSSLRRAESLPAGTEPQVETLLPISLIRLPRITLPKGSTAHYTILEQRIPYERVCFWSLDLTEQDRYDRWYRYSSWGSRRFRTFEDVAYELMRRRNLWGEVQDAILLKNQGDIAWTTAPIVVMQKNTAISQDMLLFTPPGEEAVVLLGPAPQIYLSHTVAEIERGKDKSQQEFGQSRWRIAEYEGVIQVTNERSEPARLMVRIRFVGHYQEATRQPLRISPKTAPSEEFWSWYYTNRLYLNPYTEVVWDVVVPPGTTEWRYLYERRFPW